MFLLLLIALLNPFIGAIYNATDQVTFAWDGTAPFYEVKVVWVDPTSEFEYPPVFTDKNQYVVTRPRVGHFKFMVRACNDQSGNSCSQWSESTDPTVSTVNGVPMAWIVFFKVPKPTPPIVE